MKSIVIRMLLISAAVAFVPEAVAADTGGGNVFLDAKVGKTFGKGSSSSAGSQSSWGADGGYLWNFDDQRSLGLELGYQHFGKVSDFGGNFGRDQISASAMTLGGHLQVLFGDDRAWMFQLRGGLARVMFDDDFTTNFPTSSSGTDSWSETGIYAGLGIGRKLTRGFSVILAYDHYDASDNSHGGNGALALNWIGLAAEYRFGD